MYLLESTDQFDTLRAQSDERPVAIFKHSIACPTSVEARNRVEQAIEEQRIESVSVYEVVVQDQPELSSYVESETGVKHETPQIILLKDRAVAYSAHHSQIDPAEVDGVVQ